MLSGILSALQRRHSIDVFLSLLDRLVGNLGRWVRGLGAQPAT